MISRLVLEDFKSFAGRTEVSLPGGVCVIVGKNGSGKSNLVDALRWVLGESDLVSLRARDVGDLVSRGDEGDRSSACQVTAVLKRQDDSLPRELILTRGYDELRGDRYGIESTEVSREAFLREVRSHGIRVPLGTAIQQGDVGRLLWLHPAERTRLLTQGLIDAAGEECSHRDRDLSASGATVSASEPGSLRGLEAEREELALSRSRLLASLAPDPDDPLLLGLLRALRLPEQAGEATPSIESSALVVSQHEVAAAVRLRQFRELHTRLEKRFAGFFATLVPGGEAALPLVKPRSNSELPGIQIAVRFPQKPSVPIDALSGGQRAVLGLCLALAAFLEVASPALVLDEVEPALDEALVRRLSRLLRYVSQERQILAVSHQTLMRHTAGHVLHIERKEGRSRMGMQYDPRLIRGPSAPTRAR